MLKKLHLLTKFLLLAVMLSGVNMRGQATLPVERTSWTGGAPTGWTDNAGGAYATSFACSNNNGARFDNDNQSYTVNFNGTPDELTFVFKSNNSGSTSILLVEESSNGTDYTTIVSLTGSAGIPNSCTTKGPYQLDPSTRFIRWSFDKGSSNGTMDDVNITASAGSTPPALTAAVGATVDNNFNVTFTENAAWRGAITGITVNGSALPIGAYSTTTAGQITFNTSQSPLLQTAGTKTIVVAATGYTDASVSQAIGAGEAMQLLITTQPSAPGANGVLAQQPVVIVADLYGNVVNQAVTIYAQAGDMGESEVVWTLTPDAQAFGANGVATFSGLAATSPTLFTGAVIDFYALGVGTPVSSDPFNIPGTAPALTPDAGASVDGPFTITFTDNAAWRAAITGITVNGNVLDPAAYSVTAGQITFTPSASALLQSSGSKSIAVIATSYHNATATQAIGAGVPAQLVVTTQPSAPPVNGGTVGTTVVAIRDQYNNTTTSTSTIIADVGAGSWAIGGTTSVEAVNGSATFSGITASSGAAVTGARISFVTLGIMSETLSATFNIPAPAPSNDLCGAAEDITGDINGGPVGGTLAAATFTSYTDAVNKKDVWYTFTAQCTGEHIITLNGSAGDVDMDFFESSCPTSEDELVNFSDNDGSGVGEEIVENLTQGTTYIIRVLAWNTAAESTFNIEVAATPNTPLVNLGAATNIGYDEATLTATAIIGCGDALTDYGFEYSTTSGFINGEGEPVAAVLIGNNLTTTVTGLDSGTTYYYKAFVENAQGLAYSFQGSFTTDTYNIDAPVATAATTVLSSRFTANWQPVADAESYRLDVSEEEDFGIGNPVTATEGFNDTDLPFDNGYQNGDYEFGTGTWTVSDVLGTMDGGEVVQLRANTGSLQSPAYNSVTTVTINAKKTSSNTSLFVYKLVNGNLDLVETISLTSSSYADYVVNINENTTGVQIFLEAGGSALRINTVSIASFSFTPSFVAGYENLQVNGTSQVVSGLDQGTTYYYRVRAENATPVAYSANSNSITVTTRIPNIWNGTVWSKGTPPDETDEAVIEGDFNTLEDNVEGEDLIAGYMTINSGIFTIDSGTTVVIHNEIINNLSGENFVVEHNGNLMQVNNVRNEGDIQVEKLSSPLYRLDYTIWSAPVTGQNLSDYSPQTLTNRFYIYNTANDSYDTVDPEVTNFAVGQGYLIRVPNTWPEYVDDATPGMQWEGTFEGVPNNGDITVDVSSAGERYNMIGNPYPSPINIHTFFDDNAGTLDPTAAIYFWRKRNNPDLSSYASVTKLAYTANTGVPGGDTGGTAFNADPSLWVINAGQGFIIRAAESTTNDIVFNNFMRRAETNNQFFRNGGQDAMSRLWVNIQGTSTQFSQAAIGYTPVTTNGRDYGWDGAISSDGALSIYSEAEGAKLAIQARGEFTVTDAVPLGYSAEEAGTYTIVLDHFDGVFEQDQDIFLRDNQNETYHNLKDGDYSFATEAGEFTGRFDIVYMQETMGTNNPVFNANSVVVYKQGRDLHVNSGSVDMQSVTIYDTRGRMLYNSQAINAAKTVISDLQAQEQVLIVNINTAKGTVSKKVVY